MTEQTQIVKYDIADAAISKMETDYMKLTISGIEDKAGFDMVHSARMVVKSHRVAVEKKRVDLKADALAYGRKVDSEAKRITALLTPIETHLQDEENKVQAEKDRIQAEKDRIEKERVDGIREKISAIAGMVLKCAGEDSKSIAKISNVLESYLVNKDEFQEFTDEAIRVSDETYAKIQDVLIARQKWEKEEAGRKAEAARLEEQKRTQETAQAKIDEQNRALAEKKEAVQCDLDHAEAILMNKEIEFERKQEAEAQKQRDAKIAADAAAKAIQDEKGRVAQAESDRIAKEKADKEEAARQESLRPDKEKFLLYAHELQSLKPPDIVAADSHPLFDEINARIDNLAKYIIKEANAL